MEYQESDMKNRFDLRLSELLTTKCQNSQIFTKAAYLNMIRKVKNSKKKHSHKLPEEYKRLQSYDVITVNGEEKLIVPKKKDNSLIKFFVHTEDVFQILHNTHISINHGGRNRMKEEVSKHYKNITREMIMIYLNECEICQNKLNFSKRTTVVKSIISSNEINSRCQVDLIDMQSQPDEHYSFILVYQDYLTKFMQLRPLKTKRIEEVASVLLDIFTTFGAPSILQCDNGNNITKKLNSMWSELKMVYGQSNEESIENINQDIDTILSSWLETNNTYKWSEGIKFVQFMKNNKHHTDLNCTPYEAMFGKKLKVGLKSCLPQERLNLINTEDDLELFLQSNDGDSSIMPNSSNGFSHVYIKEEK